MPSKRTNYGYHQPTKTTAKAKSHILKYLKANDLHTLTAINELLNNGVYYMSKWNGSPDEVLPLLNKPDNLEYHTEKTFNTLTDTLTKRLEEIRDVMPEHIKETDRINTRQSYKEDIRDLQYTHFEHNNAQYAYNSNSYEVNKNRDGWEECIDGIFKKNMDRPSEWYEDLYTHLKEKENFTLTFDAEEYISISSHISSWSYWSVLKTKFKEEDITSGNCSYRASEHNRV